jgi:hypothetical protein
MVADTADSTDCPTFARRRDCSAAAAHRAHLPCSSGSARWALTPWLYYYLLLLPLLLVLLLLPLLLLLLQLLLPLLLPLLLLLLLLLL